MATFDPHIPFSRAQARAAGITDHALRGATYQRLFHDVYVAAHVRVTPRLLGAAALSVVLGDSLVARGRTTSAELVVAADEWLGHGAVLARRAARLVRAGVDSPMETRLRLLLVLAGLPEPVVNHIVRNDDGTWSRRFDLSYPALRLIVEYDGRQHAQDDAQWRSDVIRREWLDAHGWRVIVILSDGIYARPEQTLRRVHRALLARGARGLPLRWNEEWRRHFPGRARVV